MSGARNGDNSSKSMRDWKSTTPLWMVADKFVSDGFLRPYYGITGGQLHDWQSPWGTTFIMSILLFVGWAAYVYFTTVLFAIFPITDPDNRIIRLILQVLIHIAFIRSRFGFLITGIFNHGVIIAMEFVHILFGSFPVFDNDTIKERISFLSILRIFWWLVITFLATPIGLITIGIHDMAGINTSDCETNPIALCGAVPFLYLIPSSTAIFYIFIATFLEGVVAWEPSLELTATTASIESGAERYDPWYLKLRNKYINKQITFAICAYGFIHGVITASLGPVLNLWVYIWIGILTSEWHSATDLLWGHFIAAAIMFLIIMFYELFRKNQQKDIDGDDASNIGSSTRLNRRKYQA